MVCFTSLLQAPIQVLCRPAMWLPCYKRLHSYREKWHVEASPADSIKAVQSALERLIKDTEDANLTFTPSYKVQKVDYDRGFLRVLVFTWAEWLDIMEFQCKDGNIEVESFSSGLCPLSLPFACLCNCVFFWVPFLDNNLNKVRTEQLRECMSPAILSQTDNTQYQCYN